MKAITVGAKDVAQYEDIIQKYSGKNHERKTIDGKNVSCSKCLGYCRYREHQGFLTEKTMEEHNCIQKGCNYLVLKEKEEQKASPFAHAVLMMRNAADIILKMAREVIADCEGLMLREVSLQDDGYYQISYVSITNAYDMDKIAERIREYCPYPIRMKHLNYTFENAYALFMQ